VHRFAAAVFSLNLAFLSIFGAVAQAVADDAQTVSFVRQVAPILVHHCQACHGAKTAESNYRLDSFESLMKAGDFGAAPITAGDLDGSELYRLIISDDAEERMPNNGDRLADAEIETIAAWIRQGAKFDGHNPAASLREQIPRDIPHPSPPSTYPTALPVTALAFTADGKRVIVGGYHELLVFDPANGELLSRVENIPQRAYGITFGPDGAFLAIAGGSPGVSGEVRLIPWKDAAPSDAKPTVLAMTEDVFFDVALRPDGKQLAAVGADGLVRVFEIESGAEKLTIESHADWVAAVAYSPDGTRLATASRDKTAKVFDAASGALLATHSEHEAPVRAVAFAPDGKSVISAGGRRVHVWSIDDGKKLGEMTNFGDDVYALAPAGENVFAASADRTVRQFKLADRSEVRSLADHPAWVVSLAVHEPSHRLAAGCLDGTVSIWDLESGNRIKQFPALPLQ
jgi:WD40 repeat protein